MEFGKGDVPRATGDRALRIRSIICGRFMLFDFYFQTKINKVSGDSNKTEA
jgi:hypothetical protein